MMAYLCTSARARTHTHTQIELVDIVELGMEKVAWPNKGPTLIDIHMELLAPFGEVRPPAQPLGELEVFLLQVCGAMWRFVCYVKWGVHWGCVMHCEGLSAM